MIVVKFGGAVLRDAQGFSQMANIVATYSEPVLVVISAIATATRDLEFAARLAQRGMLTDATERIQRIITDHQMLVRTLLPETARENVENLLLEHGKHITTLLQGISITKQLTPRTLDRILCSGEAMSVLIAQNVLQQRLPRESIGSINAHDIIVTNSEFGMAKPLTSPTQVRVHHTLLPAFLEHRIVCIQGFVGSTEDGVLTTMGKESSSLTATLLASMVDAQEVVIYSDVNGLRSADPHSIRATLPRERVSYALARLCAQNGLRLLFPTMIDPAELANIPIRIASAQEPHGSTTLISSEGANEWFVLQTPHANDTTTVTCIFATKPVWFTAASKIAALLHDTALVDVTTNFSENLAHMRVHSASAQETATIFHSALLAS